MRSLSASDAETVMSKMYAIGGGSLHRTVPVNEPAQMAFTMTSRHHRRVRCGAVVGLRNDHFGTFTASSGPPVAGFDLPDDTDTHSEMACIN